MLSIAHMDKYVDIIHELSYNDGIRKLGVLNNTAIFARFKKLLDTPLYVYISAFMHCCVFNPPHLSYSSKSLYPPLRENFSFSLTHTAPSFGLNALHLLILQPVKLRKS